MMEWLVKSWVVDLKSSFKVCLTNWCAKTIQLAKENKNRGAFLIFQQSFVVCCLRWTPKSSPETIFLYLMMASSIEFTSRVSNESFVQTFYLSQPCHSHLWAVMVIRLADLGMNFNNFTTITSTTEPSHSLRRSHIFTTMFLKCTNVALK